MSTYEATRGSRPRVSNTSPALSHPIRVFLTRGVIAIVWAAVFAATSQSLTSDVSVGAGVLLVIYPLIDVVGSLLDARGQHGPAKQTLLANAALSAVAAIALGIAATGTTADALTVFGVWAIVAGAAQLVVALRRRAAFGKQWPMRLAGAGSILIGVAYVIAAAGDDPKLSQLAIYAATGGIDFIIEAWLLGRRRRHLAASS